MKALSFLKCALGLGWVIGCKTAETPSGENPYPVVNAAPYYEVDASWPKRQADKPWGHMPGAAIEPSRFLVSICIGWIDHELGDSISCANGAG